MATSLWTTATAGLSSILFFPLRCARLVSLWSRTRSLDPEEKRNDASATQAPPALLLVAATALKPREP